MERQGKCARSSKATGVCFAWLVTIASGWATPAPQVIKGSAPDPAAVSVLQPQLSSQQLRDYIAKQAGAAQTKSGPKMANPRAAGKGQASSMVATLRTQKQAADAERNTIMASSRMAPSIPKAGGPPLTPSRALSVPVPGTPGAGTPRGAPTSIGAKSSATGVMHLPAGSPLPPAPAAAAPKFAPGMGVALGQCLRPTIGTVNGQAKGTVFSPDPQFNLYTISGCMFGDVQGQAYIYGTFAAAQVALQIEFWSDTKIVARLDPQITRELDQANVTLVVVPSGAAQVQKTGFKFYAMRETTLLTKIPTSAVHFQSRTETAGQPVSVDYGSPSNNPIFAGMSMNVTRGAYSAFKGGLDYFDFSKLRPGFTTENMQLMYWVMPNYCHFKYQVYGEWNAEWDGDNIRVHWQQQYCPGQEKASGQSYYISGVSYYGLSVWVSGPKGVSPWPN